MDEEDLQAVKVLVLRAFLPILTLDLGDGGMGEGAISQDSGATMVIFLGNK
jgi:hypothetical protein